MASSFLRFLDHTQRRIAVGRTPLDEWSALRRDLYLTTHNTHNRQTSISPVIFTIIYLFIYLFLFHYRSMTGCFLSKNLISLHIKCHFRNFHNMRCLFWLLATCHSPVHIILSISVVIFPEVNATQTKFSKLPYLIYLTHYLASIRRYKKNTFVRSFFLSEWFWAAFIFIDMKGIEVHSSKYQAAEYHVASVAAASRFDWNLLSYWEQYEVLSLSCNLM